MIDIPRAFSLSWERMVVILFQPLDAAKWSILGFNAFLVMLGEGNIQFNQPISFTQRQSIDWTSPSLPTVIHDSRQWVDSLLTLLAGPMLAVYLFIFLAAIAGWLVLNWVGCRGQFLFTDNIVRNRAAIAGPWSRYAREGNIWFLFQLALTIFTFMLMILSAGTLLLVSWAWISQERSPQGGELAVLAVVLIAFIIFWCVWTALLFIVRSFTVLLLFRQTFGFGSALGAVLQLLFTRPLSLFLYVLASALLATIGGVISLTAVCLTCCCVCSLGLIPIFGSLLITAALAQVLLPLFVYYRCFQIECLSQFGPPYDIWSVDVPPSTATAY